MLVFLRHYKSYEVEGLDCDTTVTAHVHNIAFSLASLTYTVFSTFLAHHSQQPSLLAAAEIKSNLIQVVYTLKPKFTHLVLRTLTPLRRIDASVQTGVSHQ